MQVHLNHIGGSEGVLWQVREEQFVDHPCACNSNGTLLFACGMRGHDQTTAHAIRSHWDLWAVVETARYLTFGTLLELIRWQVQACLNERMIKQVIVFATGDKGEPGHIGEHGPVAILSVETQQRAFLRQVMGRQIPTNGGDSLTQFLPIPPVPAIAKRAQPLITVCL